MTMRPNHPHSKRKYRKMMIPKNKRPTKKDLAKKHGISYKYYSIQITYPEDARIRKEIDKACKDLGLTRTNLAKQALIYYLQFIQPSKEKTTKGGL